jgi:uncharacterized protein (TIGR02996 family)
VSARDEPALLAGVIATPADDAPRLVYADWCEEHGQPERAEFIRLQCRLARLPQNAPERPALIGRERELQGRAAAWRDALPTATGVLWRGYHRGFVWGVKVPLGAFRKQGARILAAAPVQRLWLTGKLTPQTAAAVAAAPGVATVAELDMRQVQLALGGVARLAESPHLGAVRHLDFSHTRFGPDDAEGLAAARSLNGLQWLDLFCTEVGPAGATALARSGALAGLRQLTVARSGLGDAGLGALVAARFRASLELLGAESNQIGSPGARAFAGDVWPRLAQLHLDTNAIGDGAEALARSDTFPALESLTLARNHLNPETIATLRARFGDRVRL